MKIFLPVLLSLAVVFPFVAGAAATNEVATKVVLSLKDGSRLVGQTTADSLTFQAAMLGELRIPLARIRSVRWDTPTNALVQTTTGDAMRAVPTGPGLRLKTVFGEVVVPLAQLSQIQVQAAALPAELERGLLLHFSFDQVEGRTVKDDSGQGNDATILGAVPAPDRRGEPDRAMKFNGQSAWIEAQNKIGARLDKQVTVSVWVKQTGRSLRFGRIVTGGSPINTVYAIVALDNSAGVLWRPILKGRGIEADVKFLSDLSEWTLLTGTYDGEEALLYADGKKVGSTRIAGDLATSTKTFGIGGDTGVHSGDGVTSWFNGLIDEVRIYDRALSEAEVKLLYEQTK